MIAIIEVPLDGRGCNVISFTVDTLELLLEGKKQRESGGSGPGDADAVTEGGRHQIWEGGRPGVEESRKALTA
jgi:hypothetical protein